MKRQICYLKAGPGTLTGREHAYHTGGPESFVYFTGNVLEGVVAEGVDDRALLNVRTGGNIVGKPFDVIAPRTEPATVAMQRVLDDADATLPKRDAVDARIVADVKNGIGRLIDSLDQVGGWPKLESKPAPADADKDGMPDAWEQQARLNPNDAEDRIADGDGDGYTNLEEYLNQTNVRARD